MRIGFNAKQAFYNKSGLGSYSRNLIQGLTLKYPDNEYILYTPGINPDLFQAAGKHGLQVSGPVKVSHRTFRSHWYNYYLSHQIIDDRIDLFHGLANEIPYHFPGKQIRSVVTIHDLIFLRMPHLYGTLERVIFTRKFKYACETVNRVVAVSKQTRNDIIDFFNIPESKIDVVYQGCNTAFSDEIPLIEKEILRMKYLLPKSFILYVGTIEERKNLLTLIKAMHYGKIDMPLVVIGKATKYLNKIIEFIERHSLINVIFCDNAQNQDLPGIYQLADLFVYPSIFEGFGIPILEAISSKVPVITSKGSCFSEAGGTYTLYVDPNSVEEMAAAIKKVLDDIELREKMIAEGYKHSRNFVQEKVCTNIMQVYQRALSDE